MKKGTIYTDQVISAVVLDGIIREEQLYVDRLTEIQLQAAESIQSAHEALNESLGYVENVRDFVSDPAHILGAMPTKHGEIAEHVQVEIGNAQRVMQHLQPNATFDGVGRTAPEDYLIDGLQVQSKFLNNANRSLDAVLGHMKDYPGFAENGYYHIPKDQYDIIKMGLKNSPGPFDAHAQERCKEIVSQIEKESGKPFEEVVKPSISTYKEVQLGKIDDTLNQHEQTFKTQHREEVQTIRKKEVADSQEAAHIKDATWGKAAQAGAISSVITGTTMAGLKVYSKIRSGKKLTQFTVDDWKDVGYDFSVGGIKGGISGVSIYWLTKKNVFSAPFAGAVTSTAIGISSLAYQLKKGTISKLEFSESVNALSVEAGLSAIGAAVGQAVIPVPILGAIVGTAVSKSALEICKYVLGKGEKDLIAKMESEYDELVKSMDSECIKIIGVMDKYYNQLGNYIEAALSPISAARLYGSIELCRFLKVPEKLIVHNTQELDEFMLL